jgi:prolyl-tRNA editing enzyme YbaK/EbsC (Cys-tRNA(Pro) deacylase)
MTSDVDPVAAALKAVGLTVEFRTCPTGTATAEQAAAAVGCDIGQIVKSLVFVADGDVVLALVSGVNRVDEKKLTELLDGVPVRKATAREVQKLTGFSIGVVPPLGHRIPVLVFLDRDLLDHRVLWSASGVPNRIFPMAPVMLSAAAGANIVDLKA